MIPDDAKPDDNGSRAFEHAAGEFWNTMRNLFTAYVVESTPTADEAEAFLSMPEWENLPGCPSVTFVKDVFGPIAQALAEPMLGLAEHGREMHGGES